MKNVVTLIALSLLMAGCVSNGKVSVNREQLQHHRFVLQSVNGKAVTATNPPELSFGENMTVSGKMCNQFHGQGKLSDGELKVKDMAMTRMMCADPQLNALDGIVSEMFKQGAQVDLTADQLTLATAEQTLTYKLADLM
ncbi:MULTISPECIES: heat shock protein HslJ [Citrobacter freundii complex]|uniref:heat shock protein HslJ n=1 Tax=Citrobacter freundii complex TaxID=1344959 RepID=UPI0006522643|nr:MULTISPECIES: heat shock protein HslJ [Citrobacter freundii complex]HAT2259080.1 heat shock protein HslJ [Citrobacter freundii]KLV75216.1 heat shock protein HslJ [Citrobacter sp. MGH110]MBW7621487.1 heat shock protein HslJ [Citrobacter portucalensis]MBW7640405.1 heat shock protein HslJ [Citrobacter portucalensis]MCA2135037.1 heat shock protein HslJ [Citrobacter portucalensis]